MIALNLKNHIISSDSSEKTIFLSGIGGIGISAIAETLWHLGFEVLGSDLVANNNTERLESKGIKIYIGQNSQNIKNQKIDFLVRSSAILDNNPEIIAAFSANIPVLSRAEILSGILSLKDAIIISGSHGKTTTTSLIGHILHNSHIDPTVISGGIINSHNSNFIIGKGEWLVAEADESDGSFTHLSSKISIITNIEAEHMDYFKTMDNLKSAFRQYIENVPDEGFNIICYDDEICQELVALSSKQNIITYGFDQSAEIRIEDVNYKDQIAYFKLSSKNLNISFEEETIFALPLLGNHNILNAVAAIISAKLLKLSDQDICSYLQDFQGVARRLTFLGEVDHIKIYDDYAHHPTEIIATLGSVKNALLSEKGNLIAVFQPHRFSRLRDHYDEFVKSFSFADRILISDIYAAGENPINGISKEKLCQDISKQNKKCELIQDWSKLPDNIKQIAKSGDVVICMGAGDITKYANLLPKQLSVAI